MIKNDFDLENEYDVELEEMSEKNNGLKWLNIGVITIIIIIAILLILICSKIGNIGYKSISTWQQLDEIVLTNDDLEITKDTDLNIFNNKNSNGKKMISPGSKGTYRFCVKNESNDNLIYNIRFSDDMTCNINMKYKLKIDNIYIRGNEEQYVGIDELDVDSIIVTKDSSNIYTLEWCWIDDDENDLQAGIAKDRQYYTLRLEFYSNVYNKRS